MYTDSHYKYKFSHNERSERAILLLHGANSGLDSEFMKNLWQRIYPLETCLALEFPFIENKEKPSEDLAEEVAVLQDGAEFLKANGVIHTHIVAKSLGGIVASRWLRVTDPEVYSADLSVLGFVSGEVTVDGLQDKLRLVVQGSDDHYGNAADIKSQLAKKFIGCSVVNIAGGDHSFRSEDGTGKLQQIAIEAVAEHLLIRPMGEIDL